MITLTSALAIPNIGKIRALRLPFEVSATEYNVFVRAQTLNNLRGIDFVLVVRNGACDVLKVNPNATAFDDAVYVERGSLNVPTGGDQMEAAIRSGANKSAQLRAIETALQTIGAIEAALQGSVS